MDNAPHKNAWPLLAQSCRTLLLATEICARPTGQRFSLTGCFVLFFSLSKHNSEALMKLLNRLNHRYGKGRYSLQFKTSCCRGKGRDKAPPGLNNSLSGKSGRKRMTQLKNLKLCIPDVLIMTAKVMHIYIMRC